MVILGPLGFSRNPTNSLNPQSHGAEDVGFSNGIQEEAAWHSVIQQTTHRPVHACCLANAETPNSLN